MRKLDIKVRIKDNKIYSRLEADGFPEGSIGRMEIVGILENLKDIELNKLRTSSTTLPAQPNDEYYIVPDKSFKRRFK